MVVVGLFVLGELSIKLANELFLLTVLEVEDFFLLVATELKPVKHLQQLVGISL